jgi:hypothetical protein
MMPMRSFFTGEKAPGRSVLTRRDATGWLRA